MQRLSYDIIGKMAETELPKLLYQNYILRKGNTPNIQSFADYVLRCWDKHYNLTIKPDGKESFGHLR